MSYALLVTQANCIKIINLEVDKCKVDKILCMYHHNCYKSSKELVTSPVVKEILVRDNVSVYVQCTISLSRCVAFNLAVLRLWFHLSHLTIERRVGKFLNFSEDWIDLNILNVVSPTSILCNIPDD